MKQFKESVQLNCPTLGPQAHTFVGTLPTHGQAVYVTPEMTFEDVITRMKDGCVHRVFVCSKASVSNAKPVAEHVLTQSDILLVVLRHYASPSSQSISVGMTSQSKIIDVD